MTKRPGKKLPDSCVNHYLDFCRDSCRRGIPDTALCHMHWFLFCNILGGQVLRMAYGCPVNLHIQLNLRSPPSGHWRSDYLLFLGSYWERECNERMKANIFDWLFHSDAVSVIIVPISSESKSSCHTRLLKECFQ